MSTGRRDTRVKVPVSAELAAAMARVPGAARASKPTLLHDAALIGLRELAEREYRAALTAMGHREGQREPAAPNADESLRDVAEHLRSRGLEVIEEGRGLEASGHGVAIAVLDWSTCWYASLGPGHSGRRRICSGRGASPAAALLAAAVDAAGGEPEVVAIAAWLRDTMRACP